MTLTLQVGELKHREVMYFVQGHTLLKVKASI